MSEQPSPPILRRDGNVELKRDPDVYARLLQQIGVASPSPAGIAPAQFQAIDTALESVAKAHVPEGGVRAVVGNIYFNFREVLFDTLIDATKLVFSLHTGEVAGTIEAGIGILTTVCTKFSRLDDLEVVVYRELLAMNMTGAASGGAAPSDLAARLKVDGIPEPQIADALSHLVAEDAAIEIGRRYALTTDWWYGSRS